MGVHVLGNDDGAALYCSTSMWAFGPVFSSTEDAEFFLAWHNERHGGGVRKLTDSELSALHSQWIVSRSEGPGICYWCDRPIYADQQSTPKGNHHQHLDCAVEHDDLDEEQAAAEVSNG